VIRAAQSAEPSGTIWDVRERAEQSGVLPLLYAAQAVSWISLLSSLYIVDLLDLLGIKQVHARSHGGSRAPLTLAMHVEQIYYFVLGYPDPDTLRALEVCRVWLAVCSTEFTHTEWVSVESIDSALSPAAVAQCPGRLAGCAARVREHLPPTWLLRGALTRRCLINQDLGTRTACRSVHFDPRGHVRHCRRRSCLRAPSPR
jgi:hypothetical protein